VQQILHFFLRACRGCLAKLDVLVLDDWALQPLEPYGREDLLEIIDDRAERRATIITAQLPI